MISPRLAWASRKCRSTRPGSGSIRWQTRTFGFRRNQVDQLVAAIFTARAFLAARGVTPELADALGAIGQIPELVATLNDPDVRVLVHDPTNLRLRAGVLEQAAQQARAMRHAQQDPPADQAA